LQGNKISIKIFRSIITIHISFLQLVIQGCSNTIENADLKERTLQAGHNISQEYRKLLQTVLFIISKPNSSSDSKHMLQTISRMIAQYVTELISVTETIKGNVLHCFNI